MRECLSGLCLLAVLAVAIAACSNDSATKASAAPNSAAVAQQQPGADHSDAMPGCAGPNGACCGTCQEKQAQAAEAGKPTGGCPCQRARQARERAQQAQTGS